MIVFWKHAECKAALSRGFWKRVTLWAQHFYPNEKKMLETLFYCLTLITLLLFKVGKVSKAFCGAVFTLFRGIMILKVRNLVKQL